MSFRSLLSSVLVAFALLSFPAFADDGRDSGGIGEAQEDSAALLHLTSGGQRECLSQERCRTRCNSAHPDDDQAFNRCIQRCNRAPCVE